MLVSDSGVQSVAVSKAIIVKTTGLYGVNTVHRTLYTSQCPEQESSIDCLSPALSRGQLSLQSLQTCSNLFSISHQLYPRHASTELGPVLLGFW